MKTSAGIIVIYNNKILLCHPTNSSFKNTYSFPKGGVNPDETLIAAAIRECYEEVGIAISENQINGQHIVNYTKKNSSKIIKQVYLFIVRIQNLRELNLTREVIPKKRLQLEEVDWAGFLTKTEAVRKIFWRFSPLLDILLP